MVYTEVFNSISSIYGWKDKEETCIGNPDDPLDPENPIEYAIDADMFLINTRTYPLNKDDTEFNIKIGANQDGIYTNFLIISVDTYRPEYDSDDPDAANSPDTDPDDSDSDSTDSGDSDPADTGDTADTDHGDTNPSDTDAGDTGNTDSETKPGEYGGECYPNGTCNEGLTCNTDNICVEPLKKAESSGCSLLVVD